MGLGIAIIFINTIIFLYIVIRGLHILGRIDDAVLRDRFTTYKRVYPKDFLFKNLTSWDHKRYMKII